MTNKKFLTDKMSDGSTMISVGQVHFRVSEGDAENIARALREAYQMGRGDAKAEIRSVLGVDDAIDYSERCIYHNLQGG